MEGLFVSLIIGLILYVFIKFIVCIPGILLKNKFNGDMTGMTLDEISKVCGQPNSIHYGYGYILCQWQATGYHIALQFDNQKNFKTIMSESSSI